MAALTPNPKVLIDGTVLGESVAEGEVAVIDGSGKLVLRDLVEADISDFGSYQPTSEKGVAGGYASLDGSGLLPSSQLPPIAVSEFLGSVANQTAMLALSGEKGDWCVRSDTGSNFVITGSDPSLIGDWTELSYPASPVTSVAGKTGIVTLATTDITSGTFADARIAASNVTQHVGSIDHDSLLNYVANKHVDHTAVTLSAGAGLTGGGDISASRSFAVGAGDGIAVAADAVSVDISSLSDAGAFASGDKLLILETGVGIRKIDYDDLPGSGGGLSNIVEDTTPQLGGMLDVNGNAIGDGTLELLTFSETASAVNQINVTNAATGGGPIVSATGDDANIDLNLVAKGSGVVNADGNRVLTTADEGTGNGLDADTVDGSHASAFASAGHNHKLDDLTAPDDNTDLNASVSAHGLLRKLSGTATDYLDGSGNWSTPAGGGSGITDIGDAIGSGTANRVLFEDGSNQLAESANLTYGTTNTGLAITAASATTIPLRVTLAAAQTANALEVNTNGGSGGDKYRITKDGEVYINSGTTIYGLGGLYSSETAVSIDANGGTTLYAKIWNGSAYAGQWQYRSSPTVRLEVLQSSISAQVVSGSAKLWEVNATGIGFFGTSPVAQQTGVTAAQALENLGLGTSLTTTSASQLSDLSDVTSAATTNRFALLANGSAYVGRAIVEADISDLGAYLTDITGENLSSLADVTITSIAAGELLKWNGSAWINNTLSEAGILAPTDLASGTITARADDLNFSGGSDGDVWTVQADGSVAFETPAGGGGSPGGSDTQLQYNNGGAFGGMSQWGYNDANGALTYTASGDVVGLTLKAYSSQTANIFEVNTSGGSGGDIFRIEDTETSFAGQMLSTGHGSVSAPAYSFDIGGNKAYGMWYDSGLIRFSINGSESLRIGSDGIVLSNQLAGNATKTSARGIYGYKREVWNNTVAAMTSGSYLFSVNTNGSLGAARTYTLPSAQTGDTYIFADDNATHRMTIVPNTGDQIIWTDGTVVSAATGSVVTTARYQSFELIALDATSWIAVDVNDRGTAMTITA